MQEEHERIILLNRAVSVSKSRAPRELSAPVMSLIEIMQVLANRMKREAAFEFPGAKDLKELDDKVRSERSHGNNLIRLRKFKEEVNGDFRYFTLLFEYIDQNVQSFPVVHLQTFAGREIAGETDERGAVTAHVVLRSPLPEAYDDGNYRCAIEVVPSLSRASIENFFSRQLKRYAAESGLEFHAVVQRKNKRAESVPYLYQPRLELLADVGRTLDSTLSSQTLSHMVFTKRAERQEIGEGTSVIHEEVIADVELRISAREAPVDATERKSWMNRIRDFYLMQGFESRLYFKRARGSLKPGDGSKAVEEATDLLMCPREHVPLSNTPKRWRDEIDSEIAAKMQVLLGRDELWERAK